MSEMNRKSARLFSYISEKFESYIENIRLLNVRMNLMHSNSKDSIKTEALCLGVIELFDNPEELFRGDFGFDEIGVDAALHGDT